MVGASVDAVFRPPGLVECYICHREFGSRSIGIHEPQCLDKWHLENQKLPTKQRLPTPVNPANNVNNHNGDKAARPVTKLLSSRTNMNGHRLAHVPDSDSDDSLLPDIYSSGQSDDEKSPRRPGTATLERPTILDATLQEAVDMTTTTRENLKETMSHSAKQDRKKKQNRKQGKRMPWIAVRLQKETASSSPELVKASSGGRRQLKALPSAPLPRKPLSGGSHPLFRTEPEPASVPLPCFSCARSDQPERFHSHPPSFDCTALKKALKSPSSSPPKMASKNVVQRALPLNFSSTKVNQETKKVENTSSASKYLPIKVLRKKVTEDDGDLAKELENFYVILDDGSGGTTSTGRPRTLICYVCHREFGTNSLRLHERRCIEKFERENGELPESQRRSLPVRPTPPITISEWNEFAWQTQKALLIPCNICGRTFQPDRLEVHKRSCKPKDGSEPPRSEPSTSAQVTSPPAGARGGKPPSIICYICKREFGTKSIVIHQPQCLKKWRIENDRLPPHLQKKEPVRPSDNFPVQFTEAGGVDFQGTMDAIWQEHLNELYPCKHCGRTFFFDSVKKHENCCKGERRSSRN